MTVPSKAFVVAVTPPPGTTNFSPLAQAAARAGALVLFDVLESSPVQAFSRSLRELAATQPQARLGVRLHAALARDWSNEETATSHTVVIAGEHAAKEAGLAAALKKNAGQVLREVVSAPEASMALSAGYDGLVVKGNESGGRVGNEGTYVLVQRIARLAGDTPFWVQGGIGPEAARACHVAGAGGIVLDAQLALCTENDLPEELRALYNATDGTETTCPGESLGAGYRLHRRRGATALEELVRLEMSGAAVQSFKKRLWELLDDAESNGLLAMGQDGALAAGLAEKYGSVAAIIRAYRRAAQVLPDDLTHDVLGAAGPWALAHGTHYAIAQGPMTRVSDVAPFAYSVAENGGLPFLALALLREEAVAKLLHETRAALGDMPWGVGILGFAPAALRAEQLRAVLEVKPPFALLAGGRPAQSKVLEEAGIPTYIHAPTPRLLSMFLRQGARRFVFEGRECGGHVGPLSSFMLWQGALEEILTYQRETGAREPVDVLLAGGVHDDLSAAMALALFSTALAANVRIGVLMGTAYLFTEEAVAGGAINASFQEEALRCEATTLLDASGGHAIRCAPTPYADEYAALKKRLHDAGTDGEQARADLEKLNVGRLRLAAKGVERGPEGAPLTEAPLEDQKKRGMFMLGAIASMRSEVTGIQDLHQTVAGGSWHLLRERMHHAHPAPQMDAPIAIVGMGCIYPDAPNLDIFWRNILNNHDAVREVAPERWDPAVFFDGDERSCDRAISKWGGFMPEIEFDPLPYGIPPNTIASIEPMQLLMLEAVRRALDDAAFDAVTTTATRERTGVALGSGGGMGDLALGHLSRCMVEHYLHRSELDVDTRQQAIDAVRDVTPFQNEVTFPGTLNNVTSGRISNRFNLGGPNFAVDAACASSLAALEVAVKELRTGSSDVMIAGGSDTQQSPYAFLSFSNTQALSPRGRCRPFDATADGIAISEGIAAVVLKRLDDAERDGDKIYAVIRGIAGASDGREKSLTAPATGGQRRALARAYKGLEFSPADISLVEAHGTGTVLGDRTETTSLQDEWWAHGAHPQSCALGSIKSQIGHTKNAAGIAGLIKIALALHHRILPPTRVEKPAPALMDRGNTFYLNTRQRPWISDGKPRRAGVSAFGFGGTNFHAVLEEYPAATPSPARPAELFVFRAATQDDLATRLTEFNASIPQLCPRARLVDLAAATQHDAAKSKGQHRLAVVAADVNELNARTAAALTALEKNEKWPEGVFYGEAQAEGKVAVLFPGQGSQYPAMLEELATHFSSVRETFERADSLTHDILPGGLSSAIFAPPAYDRDEETAQRDNINQTWLAQPALAAADYAMFTLLQELGVQADLLGGHSFGEYVALCAGESIDFETLMHLATERGRLAHETQGNGEVGLVAVKASRERLSRLLQNSPGISLASHNAPEQIVVGGPKVALNMLTDRLDEEKISYQKLALSAGFHIPAAEAAAKRFAPVLAAAPIYEPTVPVFSNRHAAPHAAEAIRETLVEHLTNPVRFVEQLEAMYAAGARVFLEAGPKSVLGSLARQTLAGKDAIILSTNKGAHSMADFLSALAQLWAAGREVHLEKLYSGIEKRGSTVASLRAPAPSPATVLVDGGRTRPLNAPHKTSIPAPKKPQPAAVKPVTTPFSSPTAPRGGSTVIKPMSHNNQHSKTAPVTSIPAIPQPAATPQSEAALAAFQATMRQFLEYQSESQRQRQELMTRFLETQQAVLSAALGGAPVTQRPLPPVTPVPVPPVPVAMPEIVLPTTYVPAAPPVDTGSNGSGHLTAPPAPAHVENIQVTATPAPVEVDIRAIVLEMVAERTGYPVEMLDLDHNMEADLGIDSIKRTEIFGSLRERLGMSEEGGDQEEYFVQIAALRTLREVLEWLEQQREKAEPQAPTASPAVSPIVNTAAANGTALNGAGANGTASNGTASNTPVFWETQTSRPAVETSEEDREFILHRCIVSPVSSPASDARREAREEGEVVLLTEDAAGHAREAASALRSMGVSVAAVRHDPKLSGEARLVEAGRYEADLASAAGAARLHELVAKNEGRITVLSHILPIAVETAPEEALEIRSLFHLAQVFAGDLRGSGGSIVAVTAQGGDFDFGGAPGEDVQDFRPGAAAIPGFLKALSNEWSEVWIKAVDIDPTGDQELLVPQLMAELISADRQVEAGLSMRGRVTLMAQPRPHDESIQTRVSLDEESVLLVTGGARGITGSICLELARRYQPRLALVGRTPYEEEDAATAAIPAQDLKKALAQRAFQSGQNGNGGMPSPAAIEKEVAAILAAREMRENIARMQEYGAEVEYYALDVRDGESLEAVIESLYERYGKIDGVIHGAGVIEDAWLENKTGKSFDRVFDTKVLPALTLSRALRGDALQFLHFFSSVAVRIGNPGQADYAAANEALNRLAGELDRAWPARVAAIGWGPWSGGGMAAPHLREKLAGAGFEFLTPAEGVRAYVEELEFGAKGESEVLLFAGAGDGRLPAFVSEPGATAPIAS